MTMTMPRSGRPAAGPPSAPFRRTVHSEWTKFRTVRGWVMALIAAAALMDGAGLVLVHDNLQCGGAAGAPVRSGAACAPFIPTGPGGEAVTDSYTFVHQPLAARGSLTVRVTGLAGRYGGAIGAAGPGQHGAVRRGTQPWSKAGILIAASTRPGAAYAAMMVTGRHGVRMQADYVRDTAGMPGAVSAASPRWLRLVRSGDLLTGYDSADGTRWTRVGTARLAGLPATVQAGMFAASPSYRALTMSAGGGTEGTVSDSLATGTFDHVRLSGAQPHGTWAAARIGGLTGYGAPVSQSAAVRRSGAEFSVTGSGDIAPAVAGPSQAEPSGTIEDHLAGVFLGITVLVVVGAMFITAEYRRGLIKTTLAASPRRGQVLISKALVLGLATFAVGLPAIALAVLAGTALSRAEGVYVLPAGWPAELRVIAGSAAMLAVTAMLALAIGVIVRRSAVAVAAALTAIVVPWILASALLPPGAADWLLRVTPAAGLAIQQSLPRYEQVSALYTLPAYYPLAPWTGFAVLCGYAAAALALALYVLRRRAA